MSDRKTLEMAQSLRQDMSLPEMLVWRLVKRREPGKPAWRRQVPFGPYVVDFLCARAKLIVEIDGAHHQDQAEYDARRTEWLNKQGLEVVRFPAIYVLANPEEIAETMLELARERVASRGG